MARFSALVCVAGSLSACIFIAAACGVATVSETSVKSDENADAGDAGKGDAGKSDAGNGDAGNGDAGDAGDGGGSSPFASGTRLQATYYEASGVDQFVSFVDTKLGFTCSFQYFGDDGKRRCLPPQDDSSPLFYVFADAACTQPIEVVPQFLVTPCHPLEPYGIDVRPYSPSACSYTPAKARVFKRGSETTATTFYTNEAGTCISASPPVQTDSKIISLTLVEPTDFVAMAEQDEPVNSLLANHVFVGEDGSRIVESITDLMRGTQCASVATTTSDLAGRCIPEPTAYLSGFSDAACSQSALASPANCDVQLGLIEESDPVTCLDTLSIYAVGAPLETVYAAQGAQCTSGSCGDGLCYALGAKQGAASFAPLADTWIGTGAAVLLTSSTDDGVPVGPTLGFADGVTHDPCFVVDFGAPDGLRCLPDTSYGGSYFADAACTVPAINQDIVGCSGNVGKYILLTGPAPANCGASPQTVFEITGLASAVYRQSGGACGMISTPGSVFYKADKAVDPTTFPLVTLKKE